MAYNPGQDLAAVEAKMATKAALKRLGFSLGVGGVTLGFLLAVAPPQMVQNLTCYLVRAGHFELGKLGLTKLSSRDLFELAKASTLVSRDGGLWGIFLGLSGSVSATSFGLLSYLFWRRGQRSKLDHVLRGANLATAFEHNRAMRRSYSRRSLLGKKLCLGTKKLIVPEALQYLHFAFAGASGSGKSTAIEELMEQAIARGDKGLIVDLGGAFYSKFGRPQDHVLSLRDPRSEVWDFWSEEGIPEEAFASAMIESEGTTNPYFWKGARAVLASLLRTNSSVRELLIDFARPLPEIREKLAKNGELSLRIIGEGDGDQADGIIGTTVLDFAFLRELNQHAKEDQKPFSIARWINDHSDSSWTYILVTEADLEVAKPLIRTWFDVACLATLLRRPGDPAMRHTWLILDEAKTIGRLPSLPHILDKGRKFKTSVVLGFQAVSQLETVYGKSEARSILQGLQNQVLFRMSEASSAEYASEFLGEQEVEQASVGQSFDDKSERGSVNHSLVKKRLVMAEEVRNLESLNAFMRLGRHAPVRIKFRVKKRERVQEFAQSVKAVPRAVKEEKTEADNHNQDPIMPFAPQRLST